MERHGRVWSDPERTYILPDDLDLPEGDLCIVDLGGDERWVRREDVAPYEVEREEAAEYAARKGWDDIQAKAPPVIAALAALFREHESGPLLGLHHALGLEDGKEGQAEEAMTGAFEVVAGMVAAYADVLEGDPKKLDDLRRRANDIAERWEGPEKALVGRVLRDFPEALARRVAASRAAVDVDAEADTDERDRRGSDGD